jgi:putative IMPACT (imprinted ancient) family translation regulator
VGGLISAYRTAAEDALNNAVIIEREMLKAVRINYDYTATPEVMRLVREYDLQIRSQTFGSACEMTADYRLRDESRLVERLDLLKAMAVKLTYVIL